MRKVRVNIDLKLQMLREQLKIEKQVLKESTDNDEMFNCYERIKELEGKIKLLEDY